jgi:hypothetical protein
MTYEEMLAKAKREYQQSLSDARALKSMTREVDNNSQVIAILEQAIEIQSQARQKYMLDQRIATLTLEKW